MSAPEAAVRGAAPPAALPASRLLHWSIRRELWENRSIVLAPLIAAGVVLFAFLLAATHVPKEAFSQMAALDPAQQAVAAVKFYGGAAMPVLVTSILVAAFYCLDALYGERRDRSILFWKSLPVSDLLTVLSKAAVPVLVMPLIAIAVTLAMQLLLLLMGSAVLLAHGMSAAPLWSPAVLPQVLAMVFYGYLTMALWHAPLYAWLLLVSAWVRRSAFLWAVLPPLALCMVERIAFGTRYFAALLANRLAGSEADAFTPPTPGAILQLPHPDPLHYLLSPGLWLGLLVAAGLLAAAMRLRRSREPI